MKLFQDMPATYHICVYDGLKSSWAERLWGMMATLIEKAGDPEQTMLVGEVADQAALVGIVNALYNLGHIVVSVERIVPDEACRLDDTDEEA